MFHVGDDGPYAVKQGILVTHLLNNVTLPAPGDIFNESVNITVECI